MRYERAGRLVIYGSGGHCVLLFMFLVTLPCPLNSSAVSLMPRNFFKLFIFAF